MRAGSGPRVGRRRSTTQDHITDVALDLFAARGFDEDSVDDVELIRLALLRHAVPFELQTVDEEAPFRASIAQEPDLVLCDYSLPSFSPAARRRKRSRLASANRLSRGKSTSIRTSPGSMSRSPRSRWSPRRPVHASS